MEESPKAERRLELLDSISENEFDLVFRNSADADESDVATVKKAILGFNLVQLEKASHTLRRQRKFLREIVLEGKGKEGTERVKRKIHDRVRKAVTGDINTRVRDHLREKAQEPLVIRLLDKISFTFGILNIVISEAVILLYPKNFWIWYSTIIPTLVIFRYPYYRMRKWQYFLLDFCYFVQLTCMLQLYLLPKNCEIGKLNFIYSNGPLIWAIPAWRNSLVFHDMEKTTSVYIHLFPALLSFCMRWHLREEDDNLCLDHISMMDFFLSLIGYAVWQLIYFVKTEVFDHEILQADPALKTSLRWLAMDKKNSMNKITLSICRILGFMGKVENFNPNQKKTKIIFMSGQLVFFLLTIIPVPFLYSSFIAHSSFIMIMLGFAVWNASNFYIEVFARRYWNDLESKGLALKEQRLMRKLDNGINVDTETENMSLPVPAATQVNPGDTKFD